ncbi:hypothetical protein RFI_03356 [Reticulomyxa filosa]|uniref:Uncharacterized protein n=1 Tax=Reticulomyxa filosa TaxID=46433 RepID=X6P6K6_RETFI|nr:hypothetical protein RFI_03356 [Reticulomyxa filosa]|eukprot:ETO33743.1 hypothetical protein RFI_03356 [Reticulomyxa filosa]
MLDLDPSNEIEDRIKLEYGDLCAIYSNTHKKWVFGRVSNVMVGDEGRFYEIHYRINGNFISKKVGDDDKCIRRYDPFDSDIELEIICPCGTQMIRRIFAEAYGRLGEKEEKDTPATGTCDHCGKSLSAKEVVYHCPKEKTEIHTGGYDICILCTVT